LSAGNDGAFAPSPGGLASRAVDRPPNALVLLAVHARDTAGPGGRPRGAIAALSMTLTKGIHAVLGAPEDGTLALFDAVTGVRAPLRGKVLVDGRDPARTPAVRARIGALAAESKLPPAASVGAAVRLALRARGEDGHRIDAVLDPLGLSALHARSPSSLSFAEARAVELAIALTTPAPLLLALHEPLSDIAVANVHLVRERLREIAAARACVLITTSSPADARTLGDRIHVLHKGLLVREVGGDARGLLVGATAELTAWIAPAPLGAGAAARLLAAALSRGEGVRGVTWEDPREGAAKVRVQADTFEACAAALADAAVETGVVIEAIAPSTPALAEVRTATDTLLRMHLAAARGQGPRPAPVAAAASVAAAATAAASAPVAAPVAASAPVAATAPDEVAEEGEPPRSVPILPGPPEPEPPATPVNEGER